MTVKYSQRTIPSYGFLKLSLNQSQLSVPSSLALLIRLVEILLVVEVT